MSYEQLIEKIKALPEIYLDEVGLYLDSFEYKSKSKKNVVVDLFNLSGKIDINEDEIIKGREVSII